MAIIKKPAIADAIKPVKPHLKPDELIEKIEEYIQLMQEQNKPLHKAGFSLWANISNDMLNDWMNSLDAAKSQAIKKLEAASLAFEIDFLHSGKNPAGAIFALKNLHGWADKQEIEYSGSIQLLPPDADGLIAAYQRLNAAKQQRQITDAITVDSELL